MNYHLIENAGNQVEAGWISRHVIRPAGRKFFESDSLFLQGLKFCRAAELLDLDAVGAFEPPRKIRIDFQYVHGLPNNLTIDHPAPIGSQGQARLRVRNDWILSIRRFLSRR